MSVLDIAPGNSSGDIVVPVPVEIAELASACLLPAGEVGISLGPWTSAP